MNDTDPLLPAYYGYLGSKTGMMPELNSRMPPEAYLSYCEPFVGGAGVFLGKHKARFNILNDIDSDVLEGHETVAAKPRAVMRELKKLRPSRRTFNRLRDLRDTAAWHGVSAAERAANFIYIVKCSVNANMRSFSNSTKSRSTFNPHYNLIPYSAKFGRVTFEHLHWMELLKRFVLKPNEVTMFLYCDPPYVTSDVEKHYRYNFDGVEHLLLARTLAKIHERNDAEKRNVKIMVSYDDDPEGFIRSLYRPEFGWLIDTIEARYESEHRANRCRDELVITNYAPKSISTPAPQPEADWSDIPHEGFAVGGCAFAELTCCERERFGLQLMAKRSGRCRVCETKVAV